MNMYEQIGEFKPDSLIVSPDFPILKTGIGLKAGYGVLKRGSLIMRGTDSAGYIAGTSVTVPPAEAGGQASTMELSVFGILTDDVDTGTDENVTENIPAVVYQTGEFNREAILLAEGATIGTFEDSMKGIGMYLRAVQNY